MDFNTLKAQFPDSEIYQNHPLAPYTTVKIGGPADIFINTKTSDEFVKVLKFVTSNSNPSDPDKSGPPSLDRAGLNSSIILKSPLSRGEAAQPRGVLTILGNGSNVLISDSGIRGIVIKNSANNIEFLENSRVKTDSGVQLPQLLLKCANQRLTGLEEFAYIPSSVGGAIWGNIHGVNKNNFDKFLVSINVFNLQTNALEVYRSSDLKWGYDFSSLQNQRNLVILSAILQLSPGDSATSKQLITDIITKKVQTQSMNSLGSVFKNPINDSAGRIIDQELNLKGFQLGNIQISPKHANFILNLGNGTASDYMAVIRKIQSEAATKGFTLEPEIKFLGEF